MKFKSVKMFDKKRIENIKILDRIYKHVSTKRAFISINKKRRAEFHHAVLSEWIDNIAIKISRKSNYVDTKIMLQKSRNNILGLCAKALCIYNIEDHVLVRVKKLQIKLPDVICLN